jgi:hypothetical protein
MTGYSVFNHAQFHNGGICQPSGEKPSEQTRPAEPPPKPPKRVRSPRGWAVEAGLGLGPQFNDRKNK